MCYTNRRRASAEDEARRLRAEDARRHHERDVRPVRREEEPEKKPLTEKVKEMVGVR